MVVVRKFMLFLSLSSTAPYCPSQVNPNNTLLTLRVKSVFHLIRKCGNGIRGSRETCFSVLATKQADLMVSAHTTAFHGKFHAVQTSPTPLPSEAPLSTCMGWEQCLCLAEVSSSARWKRTWQEGGLSAVLS